ncbi:hypothetical protein [Cobetia sp. 5-25-4-2]|uniref:hypothetical protein n=1 Tax=Cobetia sp. 5-25-4-2 TaxID=2737459 RepID=UPI001596CA40|nr:hypothetical protein [Cobetia sp. 5-25-4-2]
MIIKEVLKTTQFWMLIALAYSWSSFYNSYILFLIYMASFISVPKVKKIPKKGLVIFFAVVIHSLIIALFLGIKIDVKQVLHFCLLILMFSIYDFRLTKRFYKVCLVLLAIILIATFITAIINYNILLEEDGRVKFIFSEPSYLGIFCTINAFLLQRDNTKASELQALVWLVLGALALSGSYMFLAPFIFLGSRAIKAITKVTALFLILILLVVIDLNNGSYLYDRITRVMINGPDISATIRFINPFKVGYDLMSNLGHFFGVGFFSYSSFIDTHNSIFNYLYKYTNGELIFYSGFDNIYGILFVAFGIMSIPILAFFISSANREKRVTSRCYLMLLPMFTGSILSPILMLLYLQK